MPTFNFVPQPCRSLTTCRISYFYFLFVIRNVATQAALIAGFAFTCITQVQMPESAPRGLHIAFNTAMALVLACELHTVIIATLCCTGGPNVAMRGHGACPRDSVDRALKGMKSGQPVQILQSSCSDCVQHIFTATALGAHVCGVLCCDASTGVGKMLGPGQRILVFLF